MTSSRGQTLFDLWPFAPCTAGLSPPSNWAWVTGTVLNIAKANMVIAKIEKFLKSLLIFLLTTFILSVISLLLPPEIIRENVL